MNTPQPPPEAPRPPLPVVVLDGETFTPEQMRVVIAKSRKYERAARYTVIAAMVGAVATMVSNVSHDLASVRVAEAKARECRP